MAGQNNIKFGVSFETDQSLKKLEQDLSKVLAGINQTKGRNGGTLAPELQKAADTARQLSNILDQCYNKDLGTTNITKFNSLLHQSHLNLQQIKADLSQVAGGADAYNHLGRSILSSNLQLQQGNKLLNEMATTMASAAKWSIAYGIMNQLTDTISNAYTYVKQLDTSLTDIRIVTGDSANEMARFAEQANVAAKNLGSNTLDYTKSALEFYQQGLDDEAVANRTEATIKAANATGANAQEVAENLTAVWNGFQVAIGDETEYVDKLAAVADSSASNLNELATAMSKVASVANNVGVDMDQLTAQISTIIATTRQAPETVGNALKTIYARINDIKAGSDEAEMSLGNYTGKMAELGISVLDSTGHLRDTGDVMEEIGNRWGTMTREQQIYLAQVMAGQRQMNNMIALFDNWTQYSEMLNVSLNAQGALDEKNARYMESTQAHLNQLKSTYQDLYSTLINTNELNSGIDLITNAIQTVNNFLEGFGGGIKSIAAFGTMVAYVFRDQIGNALNQAQRQQLEYQQNLALMQEKQMAVNLGAASGKDAATLAAYKEELAIEQQLLDVKQGLTQEEYNELNAKKTKIGELVFEQTNLEEQINALNTKVQLENTSAEAINNALMALEPELESEEELTVATERRVAALREMQQLRGQASGLALEQGSLQTDINNQVALAEKLQYTRAQATLLTSSFMMLTTAVGTTSAVVRTLTDNNASLGEKITQLVMSLGFAIPMLVTGFNQLKTSYTAVMAGMVTQTAERNALELTSINIERALAAAVRDGTITEATRQKVLAGELATLSAKEIAQLNEIGVTKVNIATLVQETLARNVNKDAMLVQIATKLGLIAATETEVVTVGALLMAYAPLIAVMAGVGLAIYGLVKAYDAQEDRAKAATEAATAAKNQASDLANGYTELKSSLEQLNDARATLNGLKEGTQEWNEAVMALNEQMLQLLETYPQIAKYLKNDNGLLTLDSAGQQAVLDEQLAKAQAAQEAAFSQQITATREQGLYEAQKIGREAGIHTASPEDIMEAAKYFAEHTGELATMGEAAARELADNTNLTQQQAAALLENKAALLELNATAQGIEALESNRAANALNQNEQYKNSEYKDAINEEYQKRWDAASSQLTEQELRANKDTLAEIYSDLTGITFTEEQLKDITKADLQERISNYRKTQELAEQEADIINTGIANGVENAKEGVDAFTAAGQAAIDKFNTENLDPSKTIAERNKAIDSIGEDRILSGDDNISAIQGALAQVGADMSDFFTLMPDGSYKLRTSAEDFKRIIDQLSLQSLSQQADELNQKVQALESATALGADRLTQTYSGASDQQHQIDFLAAAGYQDVATLGRWQENVGNLSDEDAKALAEAVQDLIGKLPELQEQLKATKEEAALAGEQLKNMVPRDDEVDAGELEDLSDTLQKTADSIEGLSDATDDAAYDDVAESLLRYKDAVEEINENYDDWIDALDNGDLMEQAEATDAIRDSMSDLLDLPFDSLSNDFVTNAENMDLMRRAAEGDTEAYDQLAAAATQDILAQVGLDDTNFQGKFTQLQSQINAGIDDIEVGAYVDDSQAIQAMNELINSADMTAQQATDLLASMGVDAQVTEQKVPKDQKQAFVDAVPHIDHHPVTTAQVLADGSISETTVQVPEITYSPNKKFETAQGQETVTALRVTSARKSSGGGIKRNLAGGGGSRGGGGGGGGKKGGGGGKAVKPPKQTKVKRDPYHDVNIKLKDNERVLKRLTTEEKKLTGQKYLTNLQKQNKELQTQLNLQKEKQRIADQEIRRQQQELKKYGFGFNAQGDLTNYLSKVQQYKNQVDALYAAAAAAPSEDANAKYEKAVKDFQEMEKAIQDYEKDVEIYKKSIEDQQDIIDQIVENNIKGFNYKVEVHLDTSDFRKEWKEFTRDVLRGIKEDDYINQAAFSLSLGQDDLADAKELVGHIQKIENSIKNIQKSNWDATYGNNSKQAFEDLEKYMKELMDKGEDLSDLQKDIKDNWLDAIDAAQDAFDQQQDQFDNINDILEHNLDMLDMLYGDEAYGQQSKIYQQQAANLTNNLEFLVKQRDFWRQQMNSVAQGSDAWKEYRDNWQDAVKDIEDATQDAADAMYNAYSANINRIAQELKDALMGGNAELMSTQWEHYLTTTDRYLDTIQRGNKGLELVQKYQDALNNKSIKQQREIKKLQEAQLDNLNNQAEVREIDYEIAEKELELLLKQQALEEARENKSKLRLRRDSQGNYRYQYVVDQEKVDQAQRELAETAAELYELTRQDYRDTVDYMNQINEDFEEKFTEIFTNNAYTIEQKQALINELYKEWLEDGAKVNRDYMEMSDRLVKHTAAAATVLDTALEGQLQEFANMPDELYKSFEQVFAPQGKLVTLIEGLTSNVWNGAFDEMPENIKESIFESFGIMPQILGDTIANAWDTDLIQKKLEEMQDYNNNYKNEIDKIAAATNQTFDDLSTNMTDTIIATENLILDNDKLINQYGDIIDQLEIMSQQIDKIMQQFKDASVESTLFAGLNLMNIEGLLGGSAAITTYDYYGNDINGINRNADSIDQVLSNIATRNDTEVLNDSISNTIYKQALDAMSAQINGYNPAIAQLLQQAMAGITDKNANSLMDQIVTINADFPNVESAAEIKAALDQIMNLASQKASGNRRNY